MVVVGGGVDFATKSEKRNLFKILHRQVTILLTTFWNKSHYNEVGGCWMFLIGFWHLDHGLDKARTLAWIFSAWALDLSFNLGLC